MWAAFVAQIIKIVLAAILGGLREKRRDREHDTAITTQAVSEQAREALEKSLAIKKEMSDAQVRAATRRSDLVDRLRREAAAETAPPPTDLPGLGG